MDPTLLRTFRAQGYDQHAKRDGQLPLTTSPKLAGHSKAPQPSQPVASKEYTPRVQFRDKTPCSRNHRRSNHGRRLEPACNSCRKRKTRCDLSSSEHSHCSECVARGVECWPKETRAIIELRRERQAHCLTKEALSRAQRVNASLQLPRWLDNHNKGYKPGTWRRFQNLDVIGQSQCSSSDLDIRNPFSDIGIIQQEQQLHPDNANEIHFKHCVEKSISACYSWPLLREVLPALETFQEQHNALYSYTSAGEDHSSFKSLLFALLAVGSLTSSGGRDFQNLSASYGQDFAEQASYLFQSWRRRFTIQHCRCAVLLSVYHAEINEHVAARLWLAQAFTLIGELRAIEPHTLNYDLFNKGPKSDLSLVNFIIYWDSALAVKSLRSPLIPKSFFNVSALSGGTVYNVAASIHSQLDRIMPIVKNTLNIQKHNVYGELTHMESSISMYAQGYPGPLSHEAFDPANIQANVLYSSALLLYYGRRFLQTKDLNERSAVLELCVRAAELMSAMIEGSFPKSSRKQEPIWQWTLLHPNWERNIRWVASALFCRHLWRCVLILCIAKRYKAAILCVQVNCTIGSLRSVNLICGQSLVFFLQRLARRYCVGSDDTKSLLANEGLLSAIMQDSDEWFEEEYLSYSNLLGCSQEIDVEYTRKPKTMRKVGIPEKYVDDWREAEHWLMMFGKHEEGFESLFVD